LRHSAAGRFSIFNRTTSLPDRHATGEGPDIPFGGIKGTGFRRELSALGIDEFVNRQTYVVAGIAETLMPMSDS
jgi:acyl-CoA reductase-like NAD-dependent aldehyde dehydrogenase